MCQRDSRTFSTDVFKLRGQLCEAGDSLESVRSENKALAEEVRDLMEELGESNRNVYEIEKVSNRNFIFEKQLHRYFSIECALLHKLDLKYCFFF